MGASVTGDTVANYYYKFDPITMEAKLDASGNIIPNYKTHTVGETTLDNYNSLRIAGDGDNGVVYEYARPRDAGYEVRVNYYEYYIFNHSYVLKDGIENRRSCLAQTKKVRTFSRVLPRARYSRSVSQLPLRLSTL